MPFVITTAATATLLGNAIEQLSPYGQIDPWRWKASLHDLFVFFPLACMVGLCMIIFIAMMFQWMTVRLIMLLCRLVCWFFCLPGKAALRGSAMTVTV